MSKRMDRADAIITEKLSQIISSLNDPRIHKNLITISSVNASSDFMYCTVIVSVLTDNKKEKEEALKVLKKSSGYIKRELASKIAMPNVPQLRFILDSGYDNTKKINEILSNLVIPAEEEDYED